MKAFNESAERQFSGLASSFSLTEKLDVVRTEEQAGRRLHYFLTTPLTSTAKPIS